MKRRIRNVLTEKELSQLGVAWNSIFIFVAIYFYVYRKYFADLNDRFYPKNMLSFLTILVLMCIIKLLNPSPIKTILKIKSDLFRKVERIFPYREILDILSYFVLLFSFVKIFDWSVLTRSISYPVSGTVIGVSIWFLVLLVSGIRNR